MSKLVGMLFYLALFVVHHERKLGQELKAGQKPENRN